MEVDQQAILEEIALEGLDGITLNTLWLRLKERNLFKNNDFEKPIKKQMWSFLVSHGDLKMYSLEVPRLTFTSFIPRGNKNVDLLINFTRSLEEDEMYPFNQVITENVRGSCSSFYNRIPLLPEDLNDYENAVNKFGDRLVVVASQKQRDRFLFGDVEGKVSPTLYCILERIGRSRHVGVYTVSNTVLLDIVNKDPKNIYRFKKILTSKKLIREKQTSLHGIVAIHDKFPNLTNIRVLLLSRFFGFQELTEEILTEAVVDFLKSQKNQQCPQKDLIAFIGGNFNLTKSVSKQSIEGIVGSHSIERFTKQIPRKKNKKSPCLIVNGYRLATHDSELVCESHSNSNYSYENESFDVGLLNIEHILNLLRLWYPEYCTIINLRDQTTIRWYELRSHIKFLVSENIVEKIEVKEDRKYRLTEKYKPPHKSSYIEPVLAIPEEEPYVETITSSPGLLNAHRKLGEYATLISSTVVLPPVKSEISKKTLRYSAKPRNVRISLLHEYLVYILKRNENTDQIGLYKFMNSVDVPVYFDAKDWRRFLPKIDSYVPDMANGWFMGIDIVYHAPLEIVIDLMRVNEIPSEITEMMEADKMTMWIPLLHQPPQIVKFVTHRQRFLNSLRHHLKYMVILGLVSVLKTPDIICLNKMHYCLHDSVKLVNNIEDGDWNIKAYDLRTLKQVSMFWEEFKVLCLKTPGKFVDEIPNKLNIAATNKAIAHLCDSLSLITTEEVKEMDRIPGDGRGTLGTPSEMMMHLERNWLTPEEISLYFFPQNKSSYLRKKARRSVKRKQNPIGSTPKRSSLGDNLPYYEESSDEDRSLNNELRQVWAKREDILLLICKAIEESMTNISKRQIKLSWQSIRRIIIKYCPKIRSKKGYHTYERRYSVLRRHHVVLKQRVFSFVKKLIKREVKNMAKVPFTMKRSHQRRLYSAFNQLAEIIMKKSCNLSKTTFSEQLDDIPHLSDRSKFFTKKRLIRNFSAEDVEKMKIVEVLQGWIYMRGMKLEDSGSSDLSSQLNNNLIDCNNLLIEFGIVHKTNSLFGVSNKPYSYFTAKYLSFFSCEYSTWICQHSFYFYNKLNDYPRNERLLSGIDYSRMCLDTVTVLMATNSIRFEVRVPDLLYKQGRTEKGNDDDFEIYDNPNSFELMMEPPICLDEIVEKSSVLPQSQNMTEGEYAIIFDENENQKPSMELNYGYGGPPHDLYKNLSLLNTEIDVDRPINDSVTRFTTNTDDSYDFFKIIPFKVDFKSSKSGIPPLTGSTAIVDSYKYLMKTVKKVDLMSFDSFMKDKSPSSHVFEDLWQKISSCEVVGFPLMDTNRDEETFSALEEMIKENLVVCGAYQECRLVDSSWINTWMISVDDSYFTPRPWKSLTGSLMLPALRHCMEGVVTRLAQVGACSLESVFPMFDPCLSVGDVIDLIMVLYKIGCIELMHVNSRRKSVLFENEHDEVDVQVCNDVTELYIYMNMSNLSIIATLECFIKCGEFINYPL